MHSRLREARKALGFKQKDVAKKMGITQSHLCAVESGTQKPSDLFVNAFCAIYGVNQSWLRKGEGDMLAEVQCPFQSRFVQEER